MSTYFKNDKPKKIGVFRAKVFDCDPESVILYVFQEPSGKALRVRHINDLPPQLLIEIGYQIVSLGKMLQQ